MRSPLLELAAMCLVMDPNADLDDEDSCILSLRDYYRFSLVTILKHLPAIRTRALELDSIASVRMLA